MGSVFNGLPYRSARQCGGGHDIERRHIGEGLDDLEAANQAAAHQPVWRDTNDTRSLKPHVALVRQLEAGDYAKKRGLTGAIRADDADDLALGDREADRVQAQRGRRTDW
jgi:hypothetical protein